MSFSSEVKQELAKQSGKSRHCQIAELAALVAFDGKRQQLIGDAGDVLDSENPLLQEKYGLLLAQLFHVNIEEIDTGRAEILTFVVPFGANKQLTLIIVTIVSLAILVIGIIVIKKKVL